MQGYANSWNGDKLHIDAAFNGVPVAAISLSIIRKERATNLYDLILLALAAQFESHLSNLSGRQSDI